MTIVDILHPLSLQEFVAHHYGKHYMRLEGQSGRFGDLVPWPSLNEILGTARVAASVAVVRKGTAVSPDAYVSSQGSGTINRRRLERRLRSGDTLVVNTAGEFFPKVQAVANSLTRIFRVPVGANLYAGFRRLNGFDLHWDEHDTLILQVHGSKHWRVFEPTRLNPVSRRRPLDMVYPTGAPVWEGLLDDGDVLYMPRGWWHVAEPVEGPSLHVTFSIRQPTGIQLLEWLVDNLKDVDIARQNLPLFEGSDIQQHLAEQLGRALVERLNGESIEQYFASKEASIGRGLPVSLPDAARDLPIQSSTPLVLTSGRRLIFEETSVGQKSFWFGGKFWPCETGFMPALTCLEDEEGHSSDELAAKVPNDVRPSLRLFLTALVESGVLAPYVSPRESARALEMSAD